MSASKPFPEDIEAMASLASMGGGLPMAAETWVEAEASLMSLYLEVFSHETFNLMHPALWAQWRPERRLPNIMENQG